MRNSEVKDQLKTLQCTCLKVRMDGLCLILLGFRRFKFNDAGTDIDRKQDMDILDFLLAMNLLARIVYDKKLRCKFRVL